VGAMSLQRVLLLGASGTIGQAVLRALLQRGHPVVCLGRREPVPMPRDLDPAAHAVRFLACDFREALAVKNALQQAGPIDTVISCMASRTGTPTDAWAVDHDAHLLVLNAARDSGVAQFILLSAICVQKPRLVFQQAKLAFEQALIASGLNYTIVRPTAFFKSLLGQMDRVRAGKPFLVFGDGQQTACKPISDRDLATFMVDCISRSDRHHRILPIGGPGPAITPLDQAKALSKQLGRPVKIRSVPVVLLDLIIGLLSAAARLMPRLQVKAELARIGRYYATESMLVWNESEGRYDAQATPESGSDHLFDAQARVLRGLERLDRGDHAVF
jgi:divinyl chlorophyllide a 8-vinyl-reductase